MRKKYFYIYFFIAYSLIYSTAYSQECNYGMKISYEGITESCNRIQKEAIDSFNSRPSKSNRFDSLSYLGVKIYDKGCTWVLTFKERFCALIKNFGTASAQCVKESISQYAITINLHADGIPKWQVETIEGKGEEASVTFFAELLKFYFSEKK